MINKNELLKFLIEYSGDEDNIAQVKKSIRKNMVQKLYKML